MLLSADDPLAVLRLKWTALLIGFPCPGAVALLAVVVGLLHLPDQAALLIGGAGIVLLATSVVLWRRAKSDRRRAVECGAVRKSLDAATLDAMDLVRQAQAQVEET